LNHEPVFRQTWPEERANAASHALGCVLALAAMPVLADQVDVDRHPIRHVGVTVFIATMVLMYLVSTVYHALPVGAAKRTMRRLDQAAIFVFIAGSYTPFVVAHIQRGEDLGLLAFVWALAICGVVLKLSNRVSHPVLNTLLYVAFGWAMAVIARPMLESLPAIGYQLVLAGGVAYTLGCVFFLLDRRMRYSHLVWHLFVIIGSSCHFMAVQHAIA
jgi:hemolysin III